MKKWFKENKFVIEAVLLISILCASLVALSVLITLSVLRISE